MNIEQAARLFRSLRAERYEVELHAENEEIELIIKSRPLPLESLMAIGKIANGEGMRLVADGHILTFLDA